MTESQVLITKAIRYCADNESYWVDKYSKEMSGNYNPYSDNDYNLFPRYNILKTIRNGIELYVGHEFDSVTECKKELIYIGNESDKLYYTPEKHNPIELNAVQDERNKFNLFITELDISTQIEVEPLPYKRRLSDKESSEIKSKLELEWGYDGFWIPLCMNSLKEGIFVMRDCLTEEDRNGIVNFLKSHSEKRLFSISEDGLNYEMELNSFEVDAYETMYVDSSYKWTIYNSHEWTIAFGGDELIRFIRKLFAGREDKIDKLDTF